jgi:hypothetical protein
VKLKIVIASFILCLGSFAKAQNNLVLNPSFEQHTQCPTQYSQISYCNGWYDGALNSTCDYFSALNCNTNYSPPLIIYSSLVSFYQQPLSGKSFAGFLPYLAGGNAREFLQGQLSSPLVAGKLYYAEYYVNATGQQKYYIHNMSALFTDTNGLVNEDSISHYQAQVNPTGNGVYKDTVKWMRISGYFTSQGGEQFITIGDFTPEGQEIKDSVISQYVYAGYFIDSVGVYEITHLDAWDAGPDKFINYGDSVQIGNPNTDLSMFDWINSINDITYLNDSTNANPWSKPWQTTTYYVTKTQGANVFKDTITVHVTGGNSIQQISNNNMQVTVYPNPAKDKIYIESKEIVEIKIVTVLGVYLYTVINEQGLVKTGGIVIIK